MAFNPSQYVTIKDITTPRSPRDLGQWLDDLLRQLSDCPDPEAKKWILLHQDLSKVLHEEVYPLRRLLDYLYGKRDDVICRPKVDNDDHDAVILDKSTSPPREIRVEITSASDARDNHNRMEYLLQHGHVSTFGPVNTSGREGTESREVEVSSGFVNHQHTLNRLLDRILHVAKRKRANSVASETQKYGTGYVLLISFDDYGWFGSVQDRATLTDYVKRKVLPMGLPFDELFIVGLSGSAFFSFNIRSV